jgi:hypothetical protein
MSRAILLLLLGLCAGTGCVTLPSLGENAAQKPPPARTSESAPPKADVLPDQVNAGNARQMAGALLHEMDAAQAPSKPAPVPGDGR